MLEPHLVNVSPFKSLTCSILFSLSAFCKFDYFGCHNFITLIKLPHLHIDPVSLRKLISHLGLLAKCTENEKSALEALSTEIHCDLDLSVWPAGFFPLQCCFRLPDFIVVCQIKMNFCFYYKFCHWWLLRSFALVCLYFYLDEYPCFSQSLRIFPAAAGITYAVSCFPPCVSVSFPRCFSRWIYSLLSQNLLCHCLWGVQEPKCNWEDFGHVTLCSCFHCHGLFSQWPVL